VHPWNGQWLDHSQPHQLDHHSFYFDYFYLISSTNVKI
jgi:hypothetical protein